MERYTPVGPLPWVKGRHDLRAEEVPTWLLGGASPGETALRGGHAGLGARPRAPTHLHGAAGELPNLSVS